MIPKNPEPRKGRKRIHPTDRLPGGVYVRLPDGTFAKTRYNRKRRKYRLSYLIPGSDQTVQSQRFLPITALENVVTILPERPSEFDIENAGWGSLAPSKAA